MKSIKSILAMLPKGPADQLKYALENELVNQYVEHEPGRFIGVNIQGLPNLSVEQTAGLYSEGTITQGQIQNESFP
jgi:hypothetical protein